MINSNTLQKCLNDFLNDIYDDIRTSIGWWHSLFVALSTILTKAIERTVAKARVRIKQRHTESFWIATSVKFYKNGKEMSTYFPAMQISRSFAVQYVRQYGNVFASSYSSARSLAYEAGCYQTPIGPENHGSTGYFWHFHPYRHRGGHIFYI